MKKKVVSIILSVLAVFAVFVACNGGKTQSKTVTVTFELNYDGAAAVTQSVTAGEYAQTPAVPKRDGYEFDGWFLKTDGGAFESEPFDFLETKIESDLTLYAKWSETEPEVLAKPTDVRISFSDGKISVSANGAGLEYSYNDGEYISESSFESGYAARVKVAVRRKATGGALASEAVVNYYTTAPDVSAFTVEDKADTYRAVTVTVENSEKYEYKFNGESEWVTGDEFNDLPEQRQQNMEIRVVESGDYPASETVIKQFEIFVDDDNASKVQYIWGGSTETSTISVNTEKEGLCGNDSVKSVKIVDNDITSYNDWAVAIPSGYTAFSADIKVIVNTETTVTKALPITNSSGKYLAVAELGKWQKIYAKGGDWIITLGFPQLNANGITGTATIYLDNITYYTDAQVESPAFDPNRFVSNSAGNGDADAIEDMESKFDITLGANGSLYKNYKDRYIIQTVAATGPNGSHLIKIKNPDVKDITLFNGVSFAIDMQMNGSGAGEIPLYLVKKGVSYTEAEAGALQDFSDTATFTKIHDYKVEKVAGAFNGAERVTIDAETLTAAGYDISDLSDLTFVFRDVKVDNGWWNVLNLYFYDFLLY